LRVLNNVFKTVPDFRSLYLETHGFTLHSLDRCVSDTLSLFNESLAPSTSNQDDSFINACSFVSALVDVFPEHSQAFQSMIVPLIGVVKEKVDAVRKSAAVCLAKLSRDEENAKVMRLNHGTEVLVSLSNVLAK
jgi:hypothetical protein